jgi:hypothetical protein
VSFEWVEGGLNPFDVSIAVFFGDAVQLSLKVSGLVESNVT